MSTTTPNLGLFKYNTSTDGKEVFSIQTALNNNWDIIDEKCGSGRNIGEIVTSTVPLTDAGLHLLDGSLINGSGIYSAFVAYIAGLVSSYPDLFISESDYQTAISNYGVCGKFVYNSTNNTVRLPKITGIIEGTTDLTALGDLVEAGLPNITGTLETRPNAAGTAGQYTNVPIGVKGAFTQIQIANGTTTVASASFGNGANRNGDTITFDASAASTIYGNSSTVQPQTIKCYYYIVIATSTKTNIQVDIDEIATDLNGKVDKADLQEVQCVIETYQNGSSWYRVYSDGWCEQGGSVTPTGSAATTSTIVYLKPFLTTYYFIVANYGSSSTNQYGQCYDLTTTQCTTKSYGGNSNIWYACGYIEV